MHVFWAISTSRGRTAIESRPTGRVRPRSKRSRPSGKMICPDKEQTQPLLQCLMFSYNMFVIYLIPDVFHTRLRFAACLSAVDYVCIVFLCNKDRFHWSSDSINRYYNHELTNHIQEYANTQAAKRNPIRSNYTNIMYLFVTAHRICAVSECVPAISAVVSPKWRKKWTLEKSAPHQRTIQCTLDCSYIVIHV